MPMRIQRKRSKGWRMPDNTICVDRSTGFGNPFPIVAAESSSMGKAKKAWCVGTWTGPAMWFCDTKEEATELSVKAFRSWIAAPGQETLREKAKLVLRGKNLACWCSAGQLCHADVWLECVNA